MTSQTVNEIKFPRKTIALASSLISLVFLLSLLIGCDNLDDGGVKLNNEMPAYAIEYIEKNKILDPTEKLVAYYDVTILLNSSEAAILTNRRVIYHKNNRDLSIQYTDIEDIDHRKETLGGDIFVIKSLNGEIMKIEIAPFNGGEVFKDILTDQLNN